ncbi:MAG: hypothetical protein II970_05320 [Paludibacteraceae bacterium]|nr:hypothetical protein [Paludibacteraceae bacterium]
MCKKKFSFFSESGGKRDGKGNPGTRDGAVRHDMARNGHCCFSAEEIFLDSKYGSNSISDKIQDKVRLNRHKLRKNGRMFADMTKKTYLCLLN